MESMVYRLETKNVFSFCVVAALCQAGGMKVVLEEGVEPS